MRLVRLAALLAWVATAIVAEGGDAAAWSAHVGSEYSFTSGITYLTASNVELQLDIYAPRGISTPNPVVVYYHGGGWAGGRRENAVLRLLPYLEMGFTVVNATYRGARVALAPAAVEDCRCVLAWVAANAGRYHFDLKKIVLTGDSAGSHLALMSGLLTPGAGLDRQCPGTMPAAAAIVNWYGAADVAALLEGPGAQGFAISWLGSQRDRDAMAALVSPLTHVRPGVPPVLTVHGEADRVVPVSQARRLHAALAEHGVVNQLVVVPGGGHGGFTRAADETSFAAIRAFLGELNLLPGFTLTP